MNKNQLKMMDGQKSMEDFVPDGKRIRYKYVQVMAGVTKKILVKDYE